jgi:hypothetical protein
MRTIYGMAQRGNRAASMELHRIAEFHVATRYTPLLQFLTQFPRPWRRILLTTIRDELTHISLKVEPDNRVVEVTTWNSRTLHEYGLRAFNLTFAQLQQIAEWMRENEDLLPTIAVHLPPGRKGDDRAAARRYALLAAFFDDFPEEMRNLLVAKARPELVSAHFEALPTGGVVLRVRASASR